MKNRTKLYLISYEDFYEMNSMGEGDWTHINERFDDEDKAQAEFDRLKQSPNVKDLTLSKIIDSITKL